MSVHAIPLKKYQGRVSGFWKFRPQVGLAVNAILFKNFNIPGTGEGTTESRYMQSP